MHDFAVIGGGIVGLSVAWQLRQRQPSRRILVIEKEPAVARHQTGHNSGVIHAGIYYEPGSLKAELCRKGVAETLRFCNDNEIPYEQCGKLIVATNADEHERMLALYERALQNGIRVELLDQAQLQAAEPNVAGVGAILSPTTGIVDYVAVAAAMARRFEELGGEIRNNAEVMAIDESNDAVTISTDERPPVEARCLVVCGGLMADRLAAMMQLDVDFRIVPYRGEYYRLPDDKSAIVRHLIYPVPEPGLPFLGVHLTRMIDGSVTVGPNAVQGWKREGYGRINFSVRDTAEMLAFPGFWRVTADNFGVGHRRNVELGLETRLPETGAEVLSVGAPRGPAALPRRDPRAGGQARRFPRGRLPVCGDAAQPARVQRAVARSDVRHPDRRGDLRQDPAERRSAVTIPAPAPYKSAPPEEPRRGNKRSGNIGGLP